MGYLVIQPLDGEKAEFLGDEDDFEDYKRDSGRPHVRRDGRNVTRKDIAEDNKFGE